MNENDTHRLTALVNHWLKQEIKLNSGISPGAVKELEIELGFCFEDSFYNYLTQINGFENFDSDEASFSFWPVSRIKEEKEDSSHPGNLICFSDHSINLCSFGFHTEDRKIYIHYQTIPGIELVANSFDQFIAYYLEDPYLLLR